MDWDGRFKGNCRLTDTWHASLTGMQISRRMRLRSPPTLVIISLNAGVRIPPEKFHERVAQMQKCGCQFGNCFCDIVGGLLFGIDSAKRQMKRFANTPPLEFFGFWDPINIGYYSHIVPYKSWTRSRKYWQYLVLSVLFTRHYMMMSNYKIFYF